MKTVLFALSTLLFFSACTHSGSSDNSPTAHTDSPVPVQDLPSQDYSNTLDLKMLTDRFVMEHSSTNAAHIEAQGAKSTFSMRYTFNSGVNDTFILFKDLSGWAQCVQGSTEWTLEDSQGNVISQLAEGDSSPVIANTNYVLENKYSATANCQGPYQGTYPIDFQIYAVLQRGSAVRFEMAEVCDGGTLGEVTFMPQHTCTTYSSTNGTQPYTQSVGYFCGQAVEAQTYNYDQHPVGGRYEYQCTTTTTSQDTYESTFTLLGDTTASVECSKNGIMTTSTSLTSCHNEVVDTLRLTGAAR